MIKKAILIIILLIAVLVMAILFLRPDDTPVPDDYTFPISDDIDNSPVDINQYEKIADGVYSVTDSNINGDQPFTIMYYEETDSYAIGLMQEPLSESRLLAEEALKYELQLSEEELCTLNYSVGVPFEVNEYVSGRNLGFSFCPGAVSLE